MSTRVSPDTLSTPIRSARLAKRQLIDTLLISAALSSLFAAILITYSVFDLNQQIHKRLDQTYLLTRNNLSLAIKQIDSDIGSNINSGILLQPEIIRSKIVGTDGITVGLFSRGAHADTLFDLSDIGVFDVGEKIYPIYDSRVYSRTLDARDGLTVIGYLHLYPDESYFSATLVDNAIRIIVGVLVLSILISLALFIVFLRRITNPIVKLSTIISAVDPRDPDERQLTTAYHRDNDEIDRLWRGMVDLVCNLKVMIGQQRRYEFKLQRLADTDPMTGLINRRALKDKISILLENYSIFSVIVFDIDHFKSVNDTYGHDIGDKTIIDVARICQRELRSSDLFARIGGEEFAVVLPASDLDIAYDAAERLRMRVSENCTIITPTDRRRVTISLGVAMLGEGDERDFDGILKAADEALYRAKKGGRDRTECAGRGAAPAKATGARDTVTAARVERALDNQEFRLVYQPKIRIGQNNEPQWAGVEALLRWQKGAFECLDPACFLGALASGPRASDLDFWVVGEACRQITIWRERTGKLVPVSINLTPAWAYSRHFADMLETSLVASLLPRHALEIEISEIDTLGEDAMAREITARLIERGVKITVDDFGVGSSSLGSVTRLPVSALKIHRTLVSGVCRDGAGSRAILRAIRHVGHDLGLDVVAEGVETEAQRDWLRAEGFANMQGFLFGKPMEAGAIERQIADPKGSSAFLARARPALR